MTAIGSAQDAGGVLAAANAIERSEVGSMAGMPTVCPRWGPPTRRIVTNATTPAHVNPLYHKPIGATPLELKHLSPSLLKKVQTQGGITQPSDGYPGPSEAYSWYAATSARAGGVPIRRMGLRRWAFFSSLFRFLARPRFRAPKASGSLQGCPWVCRRLSWSTDSSWDPRPERCSSRECSRPSRRSLW
jgi:hypothetical protein